MKRKSEKELKTTIDTSEQLTLPFVMTGLNHHENEPRDQYANLISTIEGSNIFSCKPDNNFSKNDVRRYKPQNIIVRDNKEGIKKISINPSISTVKDQTEYDFLDFNDEIVFSILMKLIALEKVNVRTEINGQLENINLSHFYTLVTTFNQLIEETKMINKEMSHTKLKKTLDKLQSTSIEIEYAEGIRKVSLIDRYDIYHGKSKSENRLLIQISGVVAEAIEDNHSYFLYNHKVMYQGGKNQIAVWIKKEIISKHRNMTYGQPLILEVENIYANSRLFDLSKANYVNKQKLKRSLSYLVEKKYTAMDITELFTKNGQDLTNAATSIISKIEDTENNLSGIVCELLKLSTFCSDNSIMVDAIKQLIEDVENEMEQKIFRHYEFVKKGSKQYIELYPNNNLISELKKINAATSFRRQQINECG